MNEEFLAYIWQHKLIYFNQLYIAGSNEKIQIIDVGSRNTDSGPDFFNARIKIDQTTWAGNVEIHVNSSDWKKHQHHNDPAYDNIILHVVYTDDSPIYRKNGQRIPTIEIKNKYDIYILNTFQAFINNSSWVPCEHQIHKIDHFTQFAWLERLCIERLETKAIDITKQLNNTHQDFQEIFYRQLCRNFGFNTNADAFEMLAKSLPFQILNRHIDRLDQIEALLYGQSGMLNKNFEDDYPLQLKQEFEFLAEKYKLKPLRPKIWKFLRMRPSNFPTIRISQFANILYSSAGINPHMMEVKRLSDLKTILKVRSNEYWHTHSGFDKLSKPKSIQLGNNSIDLILINTVIPFTFIYGEIFKLSEVKEKALLWYEQIKPEKNSITNKFSQIGLKIENAKQSQAVIQLKRNYCDKKKCLSCRFGHVLMSRNV